MSRKGSFPFYWRWTDLSVRDVESGRVLDAQSAAIERDSLRMAEHSEIWASALEISVAILYSFRYKDRRLLRQSYRYAIGGLTATIFYGEKPDDSKTVAFVDRVHHCDWVYVVLALREGWKRLRGRSYSTTSVCWQWRNQNKCPLKTDTKTLHKLRIDKLNLLKGILGDLLIWE